MFLRETMCLYCLNPLSARLGLDKKQRPYVHCTACGARSFVPLFDPGLNGLAVVPALVEAWRASVKPETWRAQLATLLAELRVRARSVTAAPPQTAEAAVQTALEKVA
jgi:hypothetical protein